MTEDVVYGLWGSKEHEWSVRNSEGRSGGILTVWRKEVIQPVFSFSSQGFLGIKSLVRGQVLYLINIYSPCILVDKRNLWRDILEWKQKLEKGEWVIAGDFNSVKNKEERRGKENSKRGTEMVEFGEFLDKLELVDVQALGNMFTWIKPNGKAGSRLDRILLSEELIHKWGVVAQVVGNRDISDHKLVWLKASRLDWGPKAFKVNRSWFEHKDFISFVKK
ncbi:uncharacterized protein LOC131650555 [Vicia villosa]|uniref:uncharacterized protein LOC131650555 n=1 Tax=Vicia villosa TaxID=3911 RepID=UPI00273BE9B0|nr:uncharacterized protein LOC131650555 [Vicia villosa]